MDKDKIINIMTSCDENLVKYIPILIQSIADAITDKYVHFFLMHYSIPENSQGLLIKQCMSYENINFTAIRVCQNDMENFRILASAGGQWCAEAYFSLMAHELLPIDVERVLYLDAADVLVMGNIDAYYYMDFEEKYIIATGIRYKEIDNQSYTIDEEDIENAAGLEAITRGLFNSGSYVMNLAKMREDGRYTMRSYLELALLIKQLRGNEQAYWGDQGLLSTVFCGNIKYYGCPEIMDYWYMPYNFCLWYFNDRKEGPDYNPAIIHFAGAIKPWIVSYPSCLSRFQIGELQSIEDVREGQEYYYKVWYELAIKTELLLKQLKL